MKIFEFQINDEKDWVCANTIFHALKTHNSITGMDLIDFEDSDDIIEIPEEKWGEYRVTDEDGGEESTFKEYMVGQIESTIIATTAV